MLTELEKIVFKAVELALKTKPVTILSGRLCVGIGLIEEVLGGDEGLVRLGFSGDILDVLLKLEKKGWVKRRGLDPSEFSSRLLKSHRIWAVHGEIFGDLF